MSSVPPGVQYSLTSSLGEFIHVGYNRAGSYIHGFLPCWCPSPFHSAFHISVVSIHSSPAIGCHSFFSFTAGVHVSAPILGEFPGLGVALGPMLWSQRRKRGVHRAEISVQIIFHSGRGRTSDFGI